MLASGLEAAEVGGTVALNLIVLLRSELVSLQSAALCQGDTPFQLKQASALVIVH